MTVPDPLAAFTGGTARRARFAVTPSPPPALPWVDGLLAGAAEVDLTPPPGLPKAGYSRNARLGTGFRTRIRARVVHLRSGTSSLAIVQCDLLGGSAVLSHLVAVAIAAETDVPLAGLFIGATHTHGAPGQFLGTDFYNRFASNKPGFDPAWTRFLVARIAGAVRAAVHDRVPARLAFGRTEVWGLTRNRSLAAHVLNASVDDRREAAQRAYAAVNPALDLLRVDTADGRPLAAMAVFSVHGTGVPMREGAYNADVWAHLVGALADRIEQGRGVRPVVGALQGTHADVAPALHPGRAGHLEATRIGRAVGAAAADLYDELDDALTGAVELGCGLREVDLDVPGARTAGGVTLPRRPAVGAALLAGAFENETPVVHRIPPFRAGSPRRRAAGAQGVKHVVGSRVGQPLLLPLHGFPRVLPVQVLKIGPVSLVGLPFELTVETGRRLAAAVPGRAVVCSVVGEYAGYVTTAEEYARQHYEGGHTLYGPSTQAFLTAQVRRLAGEVASTGLVSDVLPVRRFDLRIGRYLAQPTGVPVRRSQVGTVMFTDATGAADAFWELRWRDVAPGDLSWHEPLVRVEVSVAGGAWLPAAAGGRPVDDAAGSLELVHLGPDGRGAHGYAVRWWDPAVGAGRRHRFVLAANGGQPELASTPFD